MIPRTSIIFMFQKHTVSPMRSPRSDATRSATDIAEMRRGCATTMLQHLPWAAASSRQNCGTCVVLPVPGCIPFKWKETTEGREGKGKGLVRERRKVGG